MLDELLLEHIGRYRISFPKIMQKVFDGQGDVSATLRTLTKDNSIKSLGTREGYGNVLGGHTAYQLTAQGAARVGMSNKRAKKLNENTLEQSFRVLWLCCMGDAQFSCLMEKHLLQLFGSELGARNNAYCIERNGKRRVYKIRLLGLKSKDAYALRETEKDLLESADTPGLKEFVEHGRYGNLIVVSQPEHRKRLEENIRKRKLCELGHVRTALVPDLNEIREALND